MTDPLSSPLAPVPIAELIVAPVQAFGGDTKSTRAAFFQARALLFTAVSSEARTLGVVKCGGDGNGRVCAYVRPLVVPSRLELMGTAATPQDPLLSNSWPLDALEAMRSRCSRVVELPPMRAPLSSVTKFNQKMLDGFVTGHHKCHTRGVGKRCLPSSTGSASSSSVSTPCSSNTPSPIASPVGTPESHKRSRCDTPLSTTSSSLVHTPTKDRAIMDQEQDEDSESDHESEATIIEEQLCPSQIQLLRERIQNWGRDLSLWKRRAVFEHGIPTVIVEKACAAYNEHRLHALGKDGGPPLLDDEWFRRHLQDMTSAVIKHHRYKILFFWLNKELEIPLSQMSSQQLIPATWLNDKHWSWATVQGQMSLIQQLRFDCSLSAWGKGQNDEVSRWPATSF